MILDYENNNLKFINEFPRIYWRNSKKATKAV